MTSIKLSIVSLSVHRSCIVNGLEEESLFALFFFSPIARALSERICGIGIMLSGTV